jgi:hypothetical protein
VEQALHELGSPAVVTRDPEEADVIIALRSRLEREGRIGRRDARVITVSSNTNTQIRAALREVTAATEAAREAFALREAREAIVQALSSGGPVELLPQNSYLRRLQHELIAEHHLTSHSVGREPRRRVRVIAE